MITDVVDLGQEAVAVELIVKGFVQAIIKQILNNKAHIHIFILYNLQYQ